MTKKDPIVFGVLSDRGWILERLAREIARIYPNFSYGTEIEGTPDIVYYMTYSARRVAFDGIEIGYFTHIEEGLPAEQLFFDTATQMDHCVTQADLYRDRLRAHGVDKVTTIPCGIDHDEFRPRLQVGIVGRTYHTGRKGEAMMARLMDMEDIQFRFTGEGWPGPSEHVPDGRMGDFYRSLDYVLVPSLYEGGPMCVPEALACGIPVIAPSDIGWVSDFPHIPYNKGDADDLRRVLINLAQDKKELAAAAAEHSWQRWAEGHVKLFRTLFAKAGKARKTKRSPARTGLATARIAQVLHGGERHSRGGPSVRVPLTTTHLDARCRSATLHYGSPAEGQYDIGHLYNIWQPDTALHAARNLASRARKRVFSPILLDLSLDHFWARELPQSVRGATPGEARYASRLPALQHRYRGLLENRQAALHGYQPQPGFAARLKQIVSEVDHVIFLSAFEKSVAEALCGPVPRSTILHNPVDTAYFTPDRQADSNMGAELDRRFDLKPGTPFLLGVGRIEPRKNQLQMAELARQLDMPLVIAGHMGARDYTALVREAGGGQVHLLDRVAPHSEDLFWLYRNCALFLSLSWAEGASLSALEAASSGAPMLLSDLSSEREYFEGLAGFAGPLDIEAAIDSARATMAGAGSVQAQAQHETIRARYSWTAHVDALCSIYETLL